WRVRRLFVFRLFFFFQAEDGIRDWSVTGVQTCALPICLLNPLSCIGHSACMQACPVGAIKLVFGTATRGVELPRLTPSFETSQQIGRASCRERGEIAVGAVSVKKKRKRE